MKNTISCPRCQNNVLRTTKICKEIVNNYPCEYIFAHNGIEEKLRHSKNESSLIKKFLRENQPKTPVKSKKKYNQIKDKKKKIQ